MIGQFSEQAVRGREQQGALDALTGAVIPLGESLERVRVVSEQTWKEMAARVTATEQGLAVLAAAKMTSDGELGDLARNLT